jgi:hypothetical protein
MLFILSVTNKPFTISVECRYAEHIMLNVVMLSVTNKPFLISVFMLNVILLSVNILNVIYPEFHYTESY